MSFTSGIPASGQSLGATRDAIRNNFTNYNTVISQDHVAPNASGEGKHNKSTYPVQNTDPTTAANEIATYCKNDANSIAQFYLRRASNGSIIQMSAGPASQGTSISFGQSFIPGSFQIRWGIETFTPSGANTVAYADASRGLSNFPTATILVIATAQGTDTTQSAVPSGYSPTQFVLTTSKSSLQVAWVAIGY